MTANTETKPVSKSGRPPKDPAKMKYYDTKLHTLLVEKLADVPNVVRGGRIDTIALAEACGVVRYTVYRWFDAEPLPPTAANKLMKLPNGTLTVEDITPFVFV